MLLNVTGEAGGLLSSATVGGYTKLAKIDRTQQTWFINVPCCNIWSDHYPAHSEICQRLNQSLELMESSHETYRVIYRN